jgi:hypothetical protein
MLALESGTCERTKNGSQTTPKKVEISLLPATPLDPEPLPRNRK